MLEEKAQDTGVQADWAVQIGPLIQGSMEGVINATEANFYVATQQQDSPTYAQVSSNGGGTWQPLPNNEWMTVGGGSEIQWQLAVTDGSQVKFLLGGV